MVRVSAHQMLHMRFRKTMMLIQITQGTVKTLSNISSSFSLVTSSKGRPRKSQIDEITFIQAIGHTLAPLLTSRVPPYFFTT